jgi:hypothetical protein
MARCNVQTNTRASGVPKLIFDQGTARLSGTHTIMKKVPPSQPTPRGLELINSCAKFYANGAGVVKPRVQIAPLEGATLDGPPTRQTSHSGLSRASIGTVAAMCLVLLILPSLALATTVWWAATNRSARGPEVAARGTASGLTVQSGSAAITLRTRAAAQTASNDQSGIIIHKVKTQPITGDPSGEPDRE